MFTLCTRCRTIHPLSASQLAQAGGQVRCGQCGLGFNALDHLHDQKPDPGAGPTAMRTTSAAPPIPVLGAPSPTGHRDTASTPALEPSPTPRRWPWRVMVGLLILVSLGNLAWTFRQPLLERTELREFLARFDLPVGEARAPFHDPERIHLVSRDFHAHPTRPGVLVLSATIVNLASEAQDLPVLAVTLMDADNRLLATREFMPAEYVLPGADPGSKLEPNVHTPILLEFVDPGEHAVGFELAFR